jgi:hypothetical protein
MKKLSAAYALLTPEEKAALVSNPNTDVDIDLGEGGELHDLDDGAGDELIAGADGNQQPTGKQYQRDNLYPAGVTPVDLPSVRATVPLLLLKGKAMKALNKWATEVSYICPWFLFID